MALTETQRKVMDLIRTETGTMAYTYEQAKQIVEAVKMYIDVNIDDVAGDDIGEMTLNAITALLDTKIQKYSKYKQTETQGVYAIDPKIKRREDMINWIHDTSDPDLFPGQGPQFRISDLQRLNDDELGELFEERRALHLDNDDC